jgi:glutathione S-transferase
LRTTALVQVGCCFARNAAALRIRLDFLARIAKLYVIAASHPCATVEEGLKLKRFPYRQVELMAGYHHIHQRLRFGAKSVPAIRFADGEKVLRSRAILHRLEERVPEPALLPSDPKCRRAVEEAERWGDEVLQNAVRRIEIAALIRNPEALLSQAEASRLPTPTPLVRLSAHLAYVWRRAFTEPMRQAPVPTWPRCPGSWTRLTVCSPTG